MQTESLKQAIDYVLGLPQVQQRIALIESFQQGRFTIAQIGATVIPNLKIIRVVINYFDKTNLNNLKEDTVCDLSGTDFSNFKVKLLAPFQGPI
ncbi:MAG: hypothetical protein JWQ40_5073 [Segetibacter sp.]|nr:hypothetical protein [Segetibacter sp.]